MDIDEMREAFEAWVQHINVWRKYRGTSRACSLRQTVDGAYYDYRINDRWQAWKAATKHMESL